MLTGKKVAILIAEKFHDEEATSPRDYLQEQGVQSLLIGLDHVELTGKYGRVVLEPDKSIDQVKASEFDGLIIPGGGAPERLRIDEKTLQFVKDFWEDICALCKRQKNNGPGIKVISIGKDRIFQTVDDHSFGFGIDLRIYFSSKQQQDSVFVHFENTLPAELGGNPVLDVFGVGYF